MTQITHWERVLDNVCAKCERTCGAISSETKSTADRALIVPVSHSAQAHCLLHQSLIAHDVSPVKIPMGKTEYVVYLLWAKQTKNTDEKCERLCATISEKGADCYA